MRGFISTMSLAVLSSAAPLCAQLQTPNEAGVAMCELHLSARAEDLEAQRKFWIALGGMSTKKGPFEIMKFPGVLVFLNSASPSESPFGGSVGSVVNHVGFRVPNFQESMARWKAAGLKIVLDQSPKQGSVFAPGDVMIEIKEDASLTVPIAFHHIHFYVGEAGGGDTNSVQRIKAWYVTMFGAKPGKRAGFEAADLPGVNLTFSKSPTVTVGTRGRVLDHIGLEVKDLDAFCKKLEAGGVKFNVPYELSPTGLGSAFLTDPWGTYIELDEVLNPGE